MNKFTRYIINGCISFTFSCLFYLFFSYLNIFPPFDEEMLIHMFLISLGIISFIAVMNLFSIQSLILSRFLEVFIVLAVLFLVGAILKMFPLNWYYSSFVIITGLLTYIIVIIISFINNRMSARQINAAIRSKGEFVKSE